MNTTPCLVTGGAGFIGGALTKKLLEYGALVNVIDNKCEDEIVCKDVRDVWQMDSEFYNTFLVQPGYVFHLAALTEVMESYKRPHDYYETNVLGTLNILEMCKKHRKSIKGVLIVSSDKAYGIQNNISFCEDDRLNRGHDPYSNSKRYADELAQDYARIYGLPITIVRSGNVFGPGQRNRTTLITSVIDCILHSKSIIVHKGYWDAVREWLYIDDVVDAYIHLIQEKVDYPNIVNISFGVQASTKYIIAKIQHLMKAKPEIVEIELAHKRDKYQSLNCHKFRNLMREHYRRTDIDTALARTIEWHEELFDKGVSL